MKRRTFFAASSAAPLVALVNAQNSGAEIDVSGNKVFYRRYGQGPAILMVHGFARTSLMWRLAPKLAGDHAAICADLRAYGRSGVPVSANDHFPYSKRAMNRMSDAATVGRRWPA